MPTPPDSDSTAAPLSLRVLVAGWMVLLCLPLTLLTARHALAMPSVTGRAPSASSAGVWQAVHILAADCPCSAAVAAYLLQRGPQAGLSEKVLVVSGRAAWSAELASVGFVVELIDSDQLAARAGIHGTPWLQFIRADGSLAYSGGYTAGRPRNGAEFHDLKIWRDVRDGGSPAAYPAFGCAASVALRQLFEPADAIRRAIGQQISPL